jgi:NAD(P)-dependent dehydrogenase (short-subunit alcohol dehydrogenase family)
MNRYLDLTGKVALVTGASSGIGAATATVLADLGARVAIGYHVNQPGAEAVRDAIVGAGGTATIIKADVQIASEVEVLVARASDELGPIDILVNNAGSLIKRVPFRDVTAEFWDDVLALNLKSAALCTNAAAASMTTRKTGAIVNVCSIAGHTGGGPGAAPYSAAKAALITFTRSAAKELAPHGVRVNAVSPGVIDTPFHKTFSTPELLRSFIATIPLGRLGTPMECATVIAFLASDAASYLVGENIEINGGQLMR